MDATLAILVSLALGVGLAAATGLRVFLPLLLAGLAARAGLLSLATGFQWLASTPALVTLATAATCEVFAYYVPGVDHALDLIAGPVTVIAGVVASASVMAAVPDRISWPVAIIAGGGVAGLTKGSTALLRAKSGLLTGGLANPLVSTVETVLAATLAALAILVPVACLAAVVALLGWSTQRAGRLLFGRRSN
ncbi:MAG TPA: DUF4126 domain-containing protein [Steroidobacteraceae bacterium]|nr:DUF4126 domain-containing protein [Steroidobacteraceae bacterium]